jgi:NADPH:quinone reductase-like Zn-dependent oxidoreductase
MEKTMRAIIQHKYGGVDQLELTTIDKPYVKDKDVMIEIKAVNIASGDMRVNTLSVPGVIKPIMRLIFGWNGPRQKVRGISASGIITEVGKKVAQYKKGDKVYFINSMKAGCLADYVILKEKAVMAKIPENMSFIDAAPIAFGAMTAYHFINEKSIKNGSHVCVYGASGSVGSYALQLAKYYGAEVTIVSSKKNHQTLVKLGADYTIDYKTTDMSTLKEKYDVIFDAVGKIKKRNVKHLLDKKGSYATVKLPTKEDRNRLLKLNEIIKEGKLSTLIDSIYSVDKYKEAHLKTYNGHKVGNVVIDWDHKS